ncbi:MAG: hypothetical protein Phog2KO_44150 [Phototrophicaceae bacterium]
MVTKKIDIQLTLKLANAMIISEVTTRGPIMITNAMEISEATNAMEISEATGAMSISEVTTEVIASDF